jgi:hypothetical protein
MSIRQQAVPFLEFMHKENDNVSGNILAYEAICLLVSDRRAQ